MLFGVVALTWKRLVLKSPFFKEIRKLNWDTTLFLAAVFILVGSLSLSGWIATFASFLAGLVGGNILFGYITLIAVSVMFSAFVDNVPFLMAMLPVAMILADKLQVNPSLLLFGLLIGTSLGGNITPIGASANIVACGILKEEGYEVSFGEFARIGLPFTLVAVTAASIFVWFIWR